MLTVGLTGWIVGYAVRVVYPLVTGGEPPFPSLADAGFLLLPLTVILGWPARMSPRTQPGRRPFIDAVIVAGAVFLAFWTCLFGLLAARRMMPRRIVLILLASFAVLTAAAGVCAGGSARILGYSTGVIIEDAPIYDQFQSVEPAGELPEGLEFRVLRHRDQRIEIRLSSGRIGWVPEDRAGLP